MTHMGHKSQMQPAWSLVLLARFSSNATGSYDSRFADEKIDVQNLCCSPRSLCLPVYPVSLEILLLFGEEKPFPQGLQTKASFSRRYYLCCVASQPKTGGLETKVVIILRFCEWLAQPKLWDTSLRVPARAASLGFFTASLSG